MKKLAFLMTALTALGFCACDDDDDDDEKIIYLYQSGETEQMRCSDVCRYLGNYCGYKDSKEYDCKPYDITSDCNNICKDSTDYNYSSSPVNAAYEDINYSNAYILFKLLNDYGCGKALAFVGSNCDY